MGFAANHCDEGRRRDIARSLFTVTSVNETKGELHGLCPIHNESNPSFSYNYKKDVYKCLSCNADGDLVRLWSEVKGLDQKEGFKSFCEASGIQLDSTGKDTGGWGTAPGGAGGDDLPPLDPKHVQEQMARAWELFQPLPKMLLERMEWERGWSRKWMELLDLRLQTHYLTKKGALVALKDPDRIAIPVRDDADVLVNIRLYRPGAKQYKIISFAKTTGQARLFPARPLRDEGPVILCEGESDTICALSHGFTAVTQTSKLKKWPDEHLAAFRGRDVVIAYDADQAGQTYARFAALALAGTAQSIRVIDWPDYMEKDREGAFPADHGQDLTDFFVRHRKSVEDFQLLIDSSLSPQFDSQGNASAPPGSGGDKPLPGDLGTVAEFFEHGINNRYSFKPRLLAERLLAEYRLVSDPASGLLYLWNDTYWGHFDEDHLKNTAIRYLATEAQKSRVEDSVYQVIKLATLPHGRAVNDRLDWVCLQNGMLNIETFEMRDHDPDFYFTTIFPVALDPGSTKRCDRFLAFLDATIQTPEVIAQLQEFAGYCLTRHARYEKCLFLYGPGRDGKSTLMKLFREMVGPQNCSAVSFPDLEREFPRSSLYNKLLNISTEIGSQAIESSYFKAITSGDPIQAAFKHRDNFEFTPFVKLIFAGNILPRIKDTSDALYERFLPIKFKRQFLEGDPERDPHLFDKLKEELSEIFYWALCGLKRLTHNGRFTASDETRELLMSYRRSNSPVLSFVQDKLIVEQSQEIAKDELYGQYREYCSVNGYRATSSANFFRELETAVGHLRSYRPQSPTGSRPRVIRGVGLRESVQGR